VIATRKSQLPAVARFWEVEWGRAKGTDQSLRVFFCYNFIWVGADAKGACAVGCLATARKEGANLSG
jgi:hypothetical protein